MSNFNAANFLSTVYEESFQDKRALVPEGEYKAYIRDFKIDVGSRPNTLSCRLTLVIEDEQLAQEFGVPEVIMAPIIYLDVDPEDNNILLYGTNQNLTLGRIRTALRQNDPTQPWHFGMLNNSSQMRVKVTHRQGKNSDGTPSEDRFDGVASWSAID